VNSQKKEKVMGIVDIIDMHAKNIPFKAAHVYRGKTLTYSELKIQSDSIACRLSEICGPKKPVVVRGHKQSGMLSSFLACAKSGRPYIPVDSSLPVERLNEILENSQAEAVIEVGAAAGTKSKVPILSFDTLIADEIRKKRIPDMAMQVSDQDIVYIIYTSGSTGKPKGVEITHACLESFIGWASGFLEVLEEDVFLNQANFSFDLSVADLYCSLYAGCTLYSIDREQMGSYRDLMPALSASNASIWVSTPSFANMCLFDKRFDGTLLPQIRSFFFCGETLPSAIVADLHARFKSAKVFNTYGPTECTCAVTQVEITKDMTISVKPLPVGVVKPDCGIYILGPDSEVLDEGEEGEIAISGTSVGSGYLNNPEMTARSFRSIIVDGSTIRMYCTGDKGFLKNGVLHYLGRLDFQIKLHGYRIELEDVEYNIRKSSSISNCAVVPVSRDGTIDHLVAFVSLQAGMKNEGLGTSLAIRDELASRIPEYMIPKKIVVMASLPMNSNGKIDRKALAQECSA
jgi:D-alanine--poly(phosphoribitol) ligase subunit 1